jgi:hypothetical protein
MFDRRMDASLDRHITGNYGEDSYQPTEEELEQEKTKDAARTCEDKKE